MQGSWTEYAVLLHFMSSLFNNFKQTNSENVSTPKVGVLNVTFALKLRIYRSLKSLICLQWIRKKFSTTPSSTTLHSRSLPLKVSQRLGVDIIIFLAPYFFSWYL